jgi:hypothetical protein
MSVSAETPVFRVSEAALATPTFLRIRAPPRVGNPFELKRETAERSAGETPAGPCMPRSARTEGPPQPKHDADNPGHAWSPRFSAKRATGLSCGRRFLGPEKGMASLGTVKLGEHARASSLVSRERP